MLGVSKARGKFTDLFSGMLRSLRHEQCNVLVRGRVGSGRFSLLLCKMGITKQ